MYVTGAEGHRGSFGNHNKGATGRQVKRSSSFAPSTGRRNPSSELCEKQSNHLLPIKAPNDVFSNTTSGVKSEGRGRDAFPYTASGVNSEGRAASGIKCQALVEEKPVLTSIVSTPKLLGKVASTNANIRDIRRCESMGRKPKEVKEQLSFGREKGSSTKGMSGKGSTTLCNDCKTANEFGAVCFIGNDGRVCACTSRTALRLCKNLGCANSNAEIFAATPKRSLFSRRHSVRPLRVGDGGGKVDISSKSTPCAGPSLEVDLDDQLSTGVSSCESGSSSTAAKKLDGYHQHMRRKSLSFIEMQGSEEVTLRKEMAQERRHAEEWKLDYAIEEALQKLGSNGGANVKVLVEAFESIIPHKDGKAVASPRSSLLKRVVSTVRAVRTGPHL